MLNLWETMPRHCDGFHRRDFLKVGALGIGGLIVQGSQAASALAPAAREEKLTSHAWTRDLRNPIFVPKSSFDSKGSQGPFVVVHDDRWWMFYAGTGTDGVQRICLATAPIDKPTEWERFGPVLDFGGQGMFDEVGCTYPPLSRSWL